MPDASVTKPLQSVDAPRQLETMNYALSTQLEMLNIVEAANFLRIARTGMYRLVEKRAIRFYRVCRRLLFKKQDLIDFIERGKTDEITAFSYDRPEDSG